MDDFKIIFYIAVAIAWAIYNNYKKVQKNRPKTTMPPQAKPVSVVKEIKTGDYDSEIPARPNPIFKKQELKKDIRIFQKSQQAKPVLKDEIKKKTTAPVPFLKTDAFHPAASEKEIIIATAPVKEIIEDDLFEFKKIDIRTAIIYSEILKRPYV